MGAPSKSSDWVDAMHQLVPQEWCLSCRRCCRFPGLEDVQTPSLSAAETEQLQRAGADSKVFQPHAQHYTFTIRLVPDHQGYHCAFLDQKTHQCGWYENRPVDCRIYPFVLTKDATATRWFLAADSKCPYVQQLGPSGILRDYAQYLGTLFESPEGKALLRANPTSADRLRDEFWVVQELTNPFPPLPRDTPEGFQPVVASRKAFEEWLERTGRPLSVYHRAAWWPWEGLIHLWWGQIAGQECLLAEQGGGYFLGLPPIRHSLNSTAVSHIFEFLDRLNGGNQISRIDGLPSADAELLSRWGYAIHQIEQEYVYDRAALMGHLEPSARRLRQFPSVHVRPYGSGDLEGCLRLYVLWALRHQAGVQEVLARRLVRDGFWLHRSWLAQAKEMGIEGRVAIINGEIQGYALGVSLTRDVFVYLAEITNTDIEGLEDFLGWELCASQNVPRINTMGDASLGSLARAKIALHPCQQLPVFSATRPRR